MAMATSYSNALGTAGAAILTHIGLVDETGTELTGGSYARVAVTWAAVSSGLIRPNADLTFNVPAGKIVGGWRAFTASTSGTNHGGASVTQETYVGAGTYVLAAASTSIQH